MSDVVFILGAGASRSGGAPLMHDFLDTAADLLLVGDVRSRESFERVLRARGKFQAAHSKAQLDIDNIEALFTALELSKIIRAAPGGLTDEVPTLIEDLKTVIVETLESTLLAPITSDGPTAPKPYPNFAKLVRRITTRTQKRTVSVLTFNYDVAIDHAFEQGDVRFDYAVSSRPQSDDSVDLLKLHGSINWAVERPSGRILPISVDTYIRRWMQSARREPAKGVPLQFRRILQSHFSGTASGVQVDENPVIVPPSWNKSDYHQQLSDVWARAASHLAEAEYVFIIGYSLPETDAFFRHLYALGSIGNRGFRKIEVFNPDATIEPRFSALLGPGARTRYKFHPLRFDEAIPIIDGYFPAK